jgi:hypothetical protein
MDFFQVFCFNGIVLIADTNLVLYEYSLLINTGETSYSAILGLFTPFHIEHQGSALLIKVIIMVSHVDTQTTVTVVRTKLHLNSTNGI